MNNTNSPAKINIRGVIFDNVAFDEAVARLLSYLESGKQCALFTPNSEIVQSCIDDNSLYPIINSAELIIPDGIGVVKAGRILSTPFKGGKVAGIEVGEELIHRLAGTNHSVFLLGGKPNIAEAARDKLLEKYPGVSFAGCRDGYFKKDGEENDEVIREINESGADVLFVCLGCPAQEKWIYNYRNRLDNVLLLLALGGSLDGYSGNVKRAPKIFINLGLEWFYRLICEPKRIGRMMKLPKFYFGTWLYKLSGKNKHTV
jgi:N-acetylglucosaminyldiphosphoundecaprenol N-acetyl-beta-D-mannosaminyltransferase